MKPPVLDDKDIAPICIRHGIRRLSVFGSRLAGAARPDSDVDLLVEFDAGRIPGMLRISQIEIELGEVLGHKVDLRTADDLSPLFRDEVLSRARLAYAS